MTKNILLSMEIIEKPIYLEILKDEVHKLVSPIPLSK